MRMCMCVYVCFREIQLTGSGALAIADTSNNKSLRKHRQNTRRNVFFVASSPPASVNPQHGRRLAAPHRGTILMVVARVGVRAHVYRYVGVQKK